MKSLLNRELGAFLTTECDVELNKFTFSKRAVEGKICEEGIQHESHHPSAKFSFAITCGSENYFRFLMDERIAGIGGETARTQLNISIYFRATRVLFELNNSFKYTQKP